MFKKRINFIKDIKEGFSYLIEKESLKNTFRILISLNFFLGFAVTRSITIHNKHSSQS